MAKPYKSVLTRQQLQQLASLFRQHVQQWLEKKTNVYFNRLEEAFFSRAEQAASDASQHDFIDAVRELRQKRRAIGRNFQTYLQKAIENFFLHYEVFLEEFIHGFSPSTQPRESLELVNNEKLEEDLVILQSSHRVTSRMQNSHKEMSAYMAAVIQPKDLPSLGSPLSPPIIATCMRMALSDWEGPAQTRNLFYQVMAEDMLADLENLYPPLIRALQRVGLEPVETSVKRRRARQVTGPARAIPGGRRGGPAQDHDQTTLFSVVSLVRQLDDEERQIIGLPRAVADRQDGGGMAIRPESLAELFQELQARHVHDVVRNLQSARSEQRVLKESLVESIEDTLARKGARLHNLDQQIIDVVTMLFDFVLDDTLMPDSMKVLLIRLQMPVLQIAIRDKTFLTNRHHQVRQLINSLSRAAVRWADTGDHASDSVYGMIRKSVERILEGDNTDLERYLAVHRDFEAFLAQEERGARVAEERVSQVARGKEQLAIARRRVSDVLAQYMHDRLPAAVRRILDDAWRDVLTLTLLREGEESRAWRESVEVVRRLVESVERRSDPRERKALEAEFPMLQGDLRRGFASISYDSRKSTELLMKFQECHLAGLQADAAPIDPGCAEPQSSEMDVAATEKAADRYEEVVQSLREGQWVRWEMPGEGEKRGKLAWRSEVADLMLFVDMRGRKLAEYSSRDLVRLFREGQASLLNNIDQPFIERALRYTHQILTSKLARRNPPILPA